MSFYVPYATRHSRLLNFTQLAIDIFVRHIRISPRQILPSTALLCVQYVKRRFINILRNICVGRIRISPNKMLPGMGFMFVRSAKSLGRGNRGCRNIYVKYTRVMLRRMLSRWFCFTVRSAQRKPFDQTRTSTHCQFKKRMTCDIHRDDHPGKWKPSYFLSP